MGSELIKGLFFIYLLIVTHYSSGNNNKCLSEIKIENYTFNDQIILIGENHKQGNQSYSILNNLINLQNPEKIILILEYGPSIEYYLNKYLSTKKQFYLEQLIDFGVLSKKEKEFIILFNERIKMFKGIDTDRYNNTFITSNILETFLLRSKFSEGYLKEQNSNYNLTDLLNFSEQNLDSLTLVLSKYEVRLVSRLIESSKIEKMSIENSTEYFNYREDFMYKSFIEDLDSSVKYFGILGLSHLLNDTSKGSNKITSSFARRLISSGLKVCRIGVYYEKNRFSKFNYFFAAENLHKQIKRFNSKYLLVDTACTSAFNGINLITKIN